MTTASLDAVRAHHSATGEVGPTRPSYSFFSQPRATRADTLRVEVVRTLLDMVYPPRCPACDADIDGRAALCAACEISLYPLRAACPRCAEPVDAPIAVTCRRCALSPPPFETIHAPFRYGGQLAIALQRLKYQRRPDIARTLAPLFAPTLATASARADVIVPMPLHWRRQSSRGFNQAALLTREARYHRDVPIDTLPLRRARATAPQTSLNARDRAANVAGAFTVPRRHRARVAGRRVLLVDDVVTTGATMAAAARELLDAGAGAVSGLCLARAES